MSMENIEVEKLKNGEKIPPKAAGRKPKWTIFESCTEMGDSFFVPSEVLKYRSLAQMVSRKNKELSPMIFTVRSMDKDKKPLVHDGKVGSRVWRIQ